MQSCAQCRSCATRNQHLRNLQSPIVHSFVLAGDIMDALRISLGILLILADHFLRKKNVLKKLIYVFA